jgi:hypothetical protein
MRLPSHNARFRAIFAAVLAVSVAGCVDYTNRFDSVNLAAGDAVAANAAIHTIDPWPPEAGRTYIDASGRKIIQAIEGYTAPKAAGGGTTNITINN